MNVFCDKTCDRFSEDSTPSRETEWLFLDFEWELVIHVKANGWLNCGRKQWTMDSLRWYRLKVHSSSSWVGDDHESPAPFQFSPWTKEHKGLAPWSCQGRSKLSSKVSDHWHHETPCAADLINFYLLPVTWTSWWCHCYKILTWSGWGAEILGTFRNHTMTMQMVDIYLVSFYLPATYQPFASS